MDRLNVDVLLAIVDHLDTLTDVSRFTRTLRSIYHIRAPHLLRRGVLLDLHNSQSFLDFMRIDHPSRFEYLVQLHVNLHGDTSSNGIPLGMAPLIEILKDACYLESLALPPLGRECLENVPPDAMSMLKALNTVVLSFECCDAAQRLMQGMRSPLRKLTLDLNPTLNENIFEVDPTPFLRPFTDTLEVLSLNNISVPSTGPVFTHVHCLKASFCSGWLTELVHPLHSLFPNLTHLDINTTDELLDPEDLMDEMEDLRTSQRLVQEREGTWNSLVRVGGTPIGVYCLGLACDVRGLDLSADSLEPDWKYVVPRLLEDVHPTSLYLKVDLKWLNGPDLRYLFVGSTPAADLTHLLLELCWSGTVFHFDSTHEVNMYRMLQPLSITHLVLRWEHRMTGMSRGFVPCLAATMPSLQYILMPSKRDTARSWRINRPFRLADSNPCTPLNPEEEGRILEAEDMVS